MSCWRAVEHDFGCRTRGQSPAEVRVKSVVVERHDAGRNSGGGSVDESSTARFGNNFLGRHHMT